MNTDTEIEETVTTEINWDEFKCRCSALGALFIEPKSKSAKDAGELSETAKSYLIKVYIEEYWGRRKDISTKQMQKGILCEPQIIELVGEIDKRTYKKNEERKSNEWITGHADIVEPDIIIDVKGSWEAETFLPQLISKIDKDYVYQLQGYMWLWGKDKAQLSYGLVSAPESILNNERYYLLSRMDVATEEDPAYKVAEAELIKNMMFDDLPKEERVISYTILRDEEIISQIPGKVLAARKFLKEFYKKHTNAG